MRNYGIARQALAPDFAQKNCEGDIMRPNIEDVINLFFQGILVSVFIIIVIGVSFR